MNKSQRIYFPSGNTSGSTENNIKVLLEQEVDTIEFLSMSISTKDVYRDFNGDYGVLVGRVTANGGVGIPNAKISIFIPLSEADADNSEISSLYPYKTPRDKNIDGKRYNLLPRVARVDPTTGISSPKQPFGSFPIKEETIINEPHLNIYKKYYKYTALTNSSGDYMIFGTPIGTQTIHLSVDITDIGKYSMNPAAMVTNLGYSPNLFTDNNSKIKPSNDLNDLPNIETQEISVDIVPFWGDTTNFEIGITRQDFRIRSVLVNTFVIFGSAFTDGDNSMWGEGHFSSFRSISEMFRARAAAEDTVSMATKRIGKVTEKIYYYPNSISDARLDANPLLPTYPDPVTDMLKLDPSEYSVYKRDGDFVFIINCNRNKVITDEFGNETPVSENSANGIYTKFRGFITLEITNEALPMNFTGSIGNNTRVEPFRYKLKIPQTSPAGASFSNTYSNGTDDFTTELWRKEHRIFSGGTIYSVARFHGLTHNSYDANNDGNQFGLTSNQFFQKTSVNFAGDADPFWNVGIIATGNIGDYTTADQYEFPSNSSLGATALFGANWMNFSVHLPQVGFLAAGYSHIRDVRTNDSFHPNLDGQAGWNEYYNKDNTQKFVAGDFNTKWLARSDLHWTDFIEVPKQDILAINNYAKKGFTSTNITGLKGKYRNGTRIPTGPAIWATTACPYNGGRVNGRADNINTDSKYYFYKGLKNADCIDFIVSLGLV